MWKGVTYKRCVTWIPTVKIKTPINYARCRSGGSELGSFVSIMYLQAGTVKAEKGTKIIIFGRVSPSTASDTCYLSMRFPEDKLISLSTTQASLKLRFYLI